MSSPSKAKAAAPLEGEASRPQKKARTAPAGVDEDEVKTNAPAGVVLESLDLEADTITLRNTGATAVSLKGWKLVSKTGSQEYAFDDAATIAAGGTFTIWSGKGADTKAAQAGAGNAFWTLRFIWNNKGDSAGLVNAAGTEVSTIAAYPVTISRLDLEEDTVTITNTSSQKVALKGWEIQSVTGDQEFAFADDVSVAAGASVTVWSGRDAQANAAAAGDGNIYWTARYIWNNNGDSARLVNDEGVTVSTVTATPPNVVITALDLVADNVVITNKGTGTTSLKGWKLISKTGDQEYAFADDASIAPGASVTIWSGKKADLNARKGGDGHLFWTARYIWNNNGDSAGLVNNKGKEVSSLEASPPNVVISALDLIADTVVITNKGASATSLKGWKLISKTGDQEYAFADDASIAPGASITLWSGKKAELNARKGGDGHLFWTARYIWNNNGDSAGLVNDKGEEVSSFEVTPPNVFIDALDLVADTVTIKNSGGMPQALKGWKLMSKTGDQEYAFADDAAIAPGASITLWSGKKAELNARKGGEGHLYWTARYIWNNNGDSAGLVDASGKEVSTVKAVGANAAADANPAAAGAGAAGAGAAQ